MDRIHKNEVILDVLKKLTIDDFYQFKISHESLNLENISRALLALKIEKYINLGNDQTLLGNIIGFVFQYYLNKTSNCFRSEEF